MTSFPIEVLDDWLKLLDIAPLECDGMSRCISTLLLAHNVDHKVYCGSLAISGHSPIPLHYWLALADGQVVDIRARMWLGNSDTVPHGLFLPTTEQKYSYKEVIDPEKFAVSEVIFRVLTGMQIQNFSIPQVA